MWEWLSKSRKAKMGVAGVVWAMAGPKMMEWGLGEEQFTNVLYMVLATIGGLAAEDFGKKAK